MCVVMVLSAYHPIASLCYQIFMWCHIVDFSPTPFAAANTECLSISFPYEKRKCNKYIPYTDAVFLSTQFQISREKKHEERKTKKTPRQPSKTDKRLNQFKRRFERMMAVIHLVVLSLLISSCAGTQKFALEPDNQSIVLGTKIILPCRVVDKQGTLQWTKDDFGLGTHRNLSGFERYKMLGTDTDGDYSLEIDPVTLEDDAKYQCQVSPGQNGTCFNYTFVVGPIYRLPPLSFSHNWVWVTSNRIVCGGW